MAGHSHFKNIKRKKEAEDSKKAAAFSKISRLIISAVREKGKDPETNPTLRIAVEKAREANMPKENIERAIKRGSGEGEEGSLEPFLFEGYGSQGAAFLVQGETDNKKRTLMEVREIIQKHGGKLADPGSVTWLFQTKGIIEVEKAGENLLLSAIELGAEDVEEKEDRILIYTSLEKASSLASDMQKRGAPVVSAILGWRAKDFLQLNGEKEKKLLQALQENEAVEGVYFNIKI